MIDPANAQGHTGSWQQPPLDGGSGISPLASAFYDSWTPDGSREYRRWIRADTGSSRGEVFAIRERGRDPRQGLSWNDADVLCDTTTDRGTCSPGIGGRSPTRRRATRRRPSRGR